MRRSSFYGLGYANAADEAAGLASRSGKAGDSSINSFAVDNQLQGKFNTGVLGHTALFGIDYRNTTFRDASVLYVTAKLNVFAPAYANNWTFVAPYDDTGIKQSQVGVYPQDQIKLGRLSFLFSGRQDFASTTSTPHGECSASTDAWRSPPGRRHLQFRQRRRALFQLFRIVPAGACPTLPENC